MNLDPTISTEDESFFIELLSPLVGKGLNAEEIIWLDILTIV